MDVTRCSAALISRWRNVPGSLEGTIRVGQKLFSARPNILSGMVCVDVTSITGGVPLSSCFQPTLRQEDYVDSA